MSKDRRLGRGLAALLGEPLPESGAASPEPVPRIHRPASASVADADDSDDSADLSVPPQETPADSGLLMIAVDDIEENPFQPRREFGESEIVSLAESLKQHEMLQPVLVRRVNDGWQLISGERRLRAAIHAGMDRIPARVRDADDRLVAELAIVENLQRKDLNPIEKALSFQRYLREHGSTQEELGKRLKIDRSTIANLMRLLELPAEVQSSLQVGRITAGHAKALLPLGDARQQVAFCQRIQQEGISVRETERLVQDFTAEQDGDLSVAGGRKKKRSPKNSQLAAIEQNLRRVLGTRVELQSTTRGRGKFTIHFKNAAEFERLYAYLADDSISSEVAGS